MRSHKIDWKKLSGIIIAVTLALAISFAIIIIISDDPWNTIRNFITGPFSSFRRMGNIIEKTIPLIFTGLAASVMFQAQQFSLVADGSFILGGLATTYFSLNVNLPFGVSLLAGVIVGAIAGILGAFIPAILKSKWQVNEFVVSMMQNSMIVFFSTYILLNVVRDPSSGYLASHLIPESFKLPILIEGTRIHLGIVIALIATVLTYLFLFKTKTGYSVRMVGYNKEFSRYSGIKVFMIMFLVQIIGGALAGIGGSVEIMGMYDRYLWQASPGLGFDGMTVAILASNNPALVPISALFMAYIRTATDIMARTSSVPNEMVYIIQGLIMIMVTANLILRRRKLNKNSQDNQLVDETKELAK